MTGIGNWHWVHWGCCTCAGGMAGGTVSAEKIAPAGGLGDMLVQYELNF